MKDDELGMFCVAVRIFGTTVFGLPPEQERQRMARQALQVAAAQRGIALFGEPTFQEVMTPEEHADFDLPYHRANIHVVVRSKALKVDSDALTPPQCADA